MKSKIGLFLDLSTKSSGWCIKNLITNELLAYGRVEKYREEENDMRTRVLYMMDNIRVIIDNMNLIKL